jgi:molecular chaperone GrpE
VTESSSDVGSDRGKFSTDIAADLIAAAVDSVERNRTEESSDAVEPDTVEPLEFDPTAASAADELASLQAQLEASQATGRELMQKLKDEHERTLRALADLDNARKRAQREREEVVRFGLERLLKDVLPVIDNLDRALDLGDKTGQWEGLGDGVRMTRKLLEDTLAKHGLKAFSAMGQPFDPHLHEAMGQEEREDVPPNTVTSEVLRGFLLHDRLVRPALVMVARPKSEVVPETPPAPGEERNEEQG